MGREVTTKAAFITNICKQVYYDVHELLNTDPYWGMDMKNDTVWRVNDLVTRHYFDKAIKDVTESVRTVEMSVEELEPPEILSVDIASLNKDSAYATGESLME